MGIADELQKLEALRASGALTDYEFAAAKRRVLDGDAPIPLHKPASPANPNFLHRFTRSERDSWFGGVCGGLGAITPVPSWAWRVVFLVLVLCYGVGVIPYLLLWALVPSGDESLP